MENRWSVDDMEPYGSWQADVTSIFLSDPVRLIEWVSSVIEIADRFRVLRPVRIPEYHFYNAHVDALIDSVAAEFHKSQLLDLFDFASPQKRLGGNFLTTHLAVADRSGAIVEVEAARVADLPSSLWKSSTGTPDVDDSGYFFFDISGFRKQSVTELKTYMSSPLSRVVVLFSIYSSIWFPWLPDISTPGSGGWFDNRPLASYHTPNLNSFLQEVREITLRSGGLWSWEAAGYQGAIGSVGIDLNWTPN